MRIFILANFFLATLGQSPARATSFYERPFPDTVRDAPTIVHGKVGMSYADWGKGDEGTKRIYTYYELQIEEVVKGNAQGHTLSMRELGGEKDGIGMQVPGSAHFDRGEDVVVLLSAKNLEGSYDVWGLSMGKYNLQKDNAGHEILTGAGISGNVSDDDGAVHGVKPTNAPSASVWSLEKLRDLVGAQSHWAIGYKKNKNLTEIMPAPVKTPTKLTAAPSEAPTLQNIKSEDPAKESSGLITLPRLAMAGMVLGVFLWMRRKPRMPK